jgi:hypothetical protein
VASPEQSAVVAVAVILQALSGIAANYGTSEVYDAVTGRINHEDILHNQHLTKAVRDAIGVILRQSADEVEDKID